MFNNWFVRIRCSTTCFISFLHFLTVWWRPLQLTISWFWFNVILLKENGCSTPWKISHLATLLYIYRLWTSTGPTPMCWVPAPVIHCHRWSCSNLSTPGIPMRCSLEFGRAFMVWIGTHYCRFEGIVLGGGIHAWGTQVIQTTAHDHSMRWLNQKFGQSSTSPSCPNDRGIHQA